MHCEKKANEYGEYLEKMAHPQNDSYNIIFFHDYLSIPEYHDEFCNKLQIFNYYAPYIPYDINKDIDDESSLKKTSFVSLVRWAKDFVLSLNGKKFFLIGEGIGAAIALAVSSLLSHKIYKIVLVNPFCSLASAGTISLVSNVPKNLEEMYELASKMIPSNNKLILDKEKSPFVVRAMRKIYYNYRDYCDFCNDMCLPKTLEALKIYESNIKIPTLLILGDSDEFISPIESVLAFKSNKNVIIENYPSSKHFPILDNEKAYVHNIIKFFIDNLGLNNENKLPNKYIYQHLSDEWKKYYRYNFQEKLQDREQKEYLEKLAEYEKENQLIDIPSNLSDVEKDIFINQQIQAINQIQGYVAEAQKTKKLMDSLPLINIDYSIPANQVVTNNQGYQVFHDGHGNAFYMDYDGKWKLVS